MQISSHDTTMNSGGGLQHADLHQKILSAVSHDLKTPLSSIIGSLEIHQQMFAQLSEDKRRALLSLALQEAYRLDSFITNILDIAKLESGLVNVRYERHELGRMLEEIISQLVSYHTKERLVLERHDEPIMIEADSLLLGRCLQLIIDNAVIHGGGNDKIVLSYRQEDDQDYYRITLKDQGNGIPVDEMKHIFSKFARFSQSDQRNAGTGLGLTISREIMKLLKGTIEAVNNPEGGVIVTLRLPLRLA